MLKLHWSAESSWPDLAMEPGAADQRQAVCSDAVAMHPSLTACRETHTTPTRGLRQPRVSTVSNTGGALAAGQVLVRRDDVVSKAGGLQWTTLVLDRSRTALPKCIERVSPSLTFIKK